MLRAIRVLGWISLGLIGLVLLAAIAIWLRSEQLMRETFTPPSERIAATTDPAAIEEGGRLARIHGCLGCHGDHAQGDVLLDEPVIGKIVSPNLVAAVQRYSDAQLAGIIRRGIKPDGHTMLVMPSQTYSPLADEDLARILGFLRSLPQVSGPATTIDVGRVGRVGLAAAKFKTSARLVADAKAPADTADAMAARGRYLARTSCALCHGADLKGEEHPEGYAPDLRIAGAYSAADFRQLMKTGIGLGGRKLGVMTNWARGELSHFNDDEIEAVHTY